MKECLVFALMLGLTGMVVGQQTDSKSVFDNSRTDSSRVTSSSADTTASRIPQPDAIDRIMKLDIDAAMIDAIKQGQTLEASIDLKDVTNGIVMLFDDPSTLKPRVDEVPRNLSPDFVSGNGVLHFTLDEAGLERLKNEGLQYEYLPGEKGNYQKVSLKFNPSSNRRTTSDGRNPVSTGPLDFKPPSDRITGSTGKDFNSSNRDSLLADSSTRLNTDPMTRASRDRLSREDFNRSDSDSAFNPARTEADRYFEQQRLQERQRALDRQRNSDLARDFSPDHPHDTRLRDSETTYSRHDSRHQPNKHTFELTDQEIDALAMSTQQIRDQRERREAELERLRLEKLASDREVERANSDRERLLRELRDRTNPDQEIIARRRPISEDQFYESYRNRSVLPSDRNLSRIDSQYDLVARDRYRDSRQTSSIVSESARLKLHEAELENERLRLKLARSESDRTRLVDQQRLADLRGSNINETNGRLPLRMSDYGASIPGSQNQNNQRLPNANRAQTLTTVSGIHLTETAVDHILRSYDGTNFDQVANRVKGEVAAISAAKTRVDKFNGFLLFLFITFFALSLYLGWLAQSFYGQYGELADELRETFTATT